MIRMKTLDPNRILSSNELNCYLWSCNDDSVDNCYRIDNFAVFSKANHEKIFVNILEDEHIMFTKVIVQGDIVPNDRYDELDNVGVEIVFEEYSVDFGADDSRGLWFQDADKKWYKVERDHINENYRTQAQSLLEGTDKFLTLFDTLMYYSEETNDLMLTCEYTVEEFFDKSINIDKSHIIQNPRFYYRNLRTRFDEDCLFMLSLKVRLHRIHPFPSFFNISCSEIRGNLIYQTISK